MKKRTQRSRGGFLHIHICYVITIFLMMAAAAAAGWMNHLFSAPGGETRMLCLVQSSHFATNAADTHTHKTHLCESHSGNPNTMAMKKKKGSVFSSSFISEGPFETAEELERGAVDLFFFYFLLEKDCQWNETFTINRNYKYIYRRG